MQKVSGRGCPGGQPGDVEGRTLPPRVTQRPLSTKHTRLAPRLRAAPTSQAHRIGHPGLQPSLHPAWPRPVTPRGRASSPAGTEAHRYVESPVSAPGQTGSPQSPQFHMDPVTQCHTGSHMRCSQTCTLIHTGSHTHIGSRTRCSQSLHTHRLTHAQTHTRCPQARTRAVGAPRTPHSQLLQGEALDRLPGQRLQGVGGQVPVGVRQQTGPVSDLLGPGENQPEASGRDRLAL